MPLFIVFKANEKGEENPVAEFDAENMDAAAARLSTEPDGAYRIVAVVTERIVAKTVWGWVTEDRE